MNQSVLSMVALAEELEAYILESIPQAVTVQKYGGTLFTLKPEEKEGQFCGVFIHKKHVQISFSDGAHLQGPKNIFSGSGKRRRHVNFSSSNEVNFRELKKLLRLASKYSVEK